MVKKRLFFLAFRRGIIGFGILSILLCGCVSNVSNDPRYPTDYKVGAVYRLKEPVVVDKAGLTVFGTYSSLILSRLGESGKPDSVAEYEEWPDERKKFIAGIAPVGTLIRITEVQLEKNPEMGRMMWIRGRFVDVPWATKEAELAFISKRTKVGTDPLLGEIPMVDTDLLELVTP